MIRIVLVGWADDDWRVFRQAQWMGQVRETPEAASKPRLFFDIDEAAYAQARGEFERSTARLGRAEAIACLVGLGATEVRRD